MELFKNLQLKFELEMRTGRIYENLCKYELAIDAYEDAYDAAFLCLDRANDVLKDDDLTLVSECMITRSKAAEERARISDDYSLKVAA